MPSGLSLQVWVANVKVRQEWQNLDRNCDAMHSKEDLPANKCRLLNSFQIRHIYDTIAMLLGWLAHRLFPELSMWKDHTSVQILLRISLEPLLQLEQYKILTPKNHQLYGLISFLLINSNIITSYITHYKYLIFLNYLPASIVTWIKWYSFEYNRCCSI